MQATSGSTRAAHVQSLPMMKLTLVVIVEAFDAVFYMSKKLGCRKFPAAYLGAGGKIAKRYEKGEVGVDSG